MKNRELPRLWKVVVYIPPPPTVDDSRRHYGKHETLAVVADTMQIALDVAMQEFPKGYINACNDGGHVTHIGEVPIEKAMLFFK